MDDRLIDRLGLESTARLGAWVVGLGSGLELAVAVALDGTGAGVAVGSSAARAGFLAVPVLVGTVGDLAGLPVGFAVLPLAGLLAVVVLPRALRSSLAH